MTSSLTPLLGLPLTSLLGLLLLSPLSSSLDCQDGKIRGVNAGGWLLLEPWITPKFFEKVAAFL